MSREALVLLVCCCDFRDGAERLISSKSLRNAVIRAFPGLFRILRMCAPRRAAAVVRPREREKSADRRRRILISRLLIIRASVPRRKSPFPAYFKGFPAVSPLIPPYPAFLKYPVSPQMAFVKVEQALIPHFSKLQRQSAALHAEVIRKLLAGERNVELVAAPALRLGGKIGHQLCPGRALAHVGELFVEPQVLLCQFAQQVADDPAMVGAGGGAHAQNAPYV